jgi:uncharacterized membrane protein
MNIRPPLWVRHVMYNLRGGFLVRPLTIALGLGCTGAFLSWLEQTVPGAGDWVPRALFPSHSDPQVAQVILAGIAGSIMTVVSIVFAILLMTLTLASMQFSPRIIVSFVRDGVTQWTLGIFLGTFSYCMAALPAARSLPRPFAPVATVFGAMLLALVCVGWLLFFIHHITNAISVSHIVDRIASETESMIDEMMPSPYREIHLETPGMFEMNRWDAPVLSDRSGYIRFVDIQRLVSLAKSSRIKVRVVRRVGQFIPAGTPLLMISKGSSLTSETSAEFRNAVDLGPSRTLQQDIEFGVLQILDIALKAISPAVNDPSTAISCVDHLSRILIRFASREPAPHLFYDPPSILRVSIDRPDFEHLMDSAFEQIRMYAKGDVAVSLRLLRALGDIATATPDKAFRKAIVERGKRIVEGCAEKLGAEELRPLHTRLSDLERQVIASQAVGGQEPRG